MAKIYLLFTMIFMHIIDDYYLQGILASMKQKKWWQENAPQQKYKQDFIVALIVHSISWSFMIMLPILFRLHFQFSWFYIIALVVNATVHGIVDDLKANKFKINLVQDQTIHLIQIICTFIIYLVVY